MMLYLDRAVQVSVTEREEELGLCCDVCAVQAEGSPSSAPTGTKSTRGTDECDDSFCECAE